MSLNIGGLPPLGPLVPIRKGSKGHAHLRNWQKVSPAVLQEVMVRHAGCNVGLRLDSFLALDPDSAAAVIFLGHLDMEGKLPETVMWRSASGRLTRLYRLPPGVKVKSMTGQSNDLSLEIRTGRGHQCLIPPSQVGGKRYEWINDPWSTPVAVLPLETLKIIQGLARPPKARKGGGGRKSGTPRNAQKTRPPSTEAPNDSSYIPKGQRNIFLFRQGCRSRAWGAGQKEIEEELQELNRVKCSPPLEPEEVAGIAEKAASYPINLNLYALRGKYEDVAHALTELGGRERWIRRAALIKKLQEMTGSPTSITNPPISVPTIERVLERMRSKRLVSHRKGGWYKLPKIKAAGRPKSKNHREHP